MRIYHISSAPFSGGAARAGFRLHQGLLRQPGVESVWLDPGAHAVGPGVEKLPPRSCRDSFTKRIARRRWGELTRVHFSPTSAPASNPIGWGGIEMLEKLPVPDVWNLHWVSWFLDWETMLQWMAERAPIVWTLHDLNPLQGFWHYTPANQELTPVRLAWEQRAVELKRNALSRVSTDRLAFVGPSRWMTEACRNSRVTTGFPAHHIPYGLDTDSFQPRSPAPLRELLGIPRDAPVIGFIADQLNDPRKGMDHLKRALAIVSSEHPDCYLLTVGNGNLDSRGLRHIHLGPLHSDLLLSSFYSTCDVFVCPSLEDNLPNTVLESLACGTPVIAYAIGGMPDMIQDGVNGLLVEGIGDAAGFAVAVSRVLGKHILVSTSEDLPAAFSFTSNRQSDAYLKLYRSLA